MTSQFPEACLAVEIHSESQAVKDSAAKRPRTFAQQLMRALFTTVTAALLIYLLIVAFYALMQRKLIYYPTTIIDEQARAQAIAQGGTPWLDSNGRWLGWRVGPGATASGGGYDDNQGTRPRRALVLHGNAGMALHRGYYAELLSNFTESGPWTVYVLEYPGYGPRPGRPDQPTLVTAAVDAADQLLAQNPEPLLIIGESLGSGVASALVRERPDAALALLLIAPFDSMANVARHHMPWLPVGLLLRDRFDNLRALENFTKPLVVITAGQDQVVPGVLAEPLIRQHSGPGLHQVQAGAGHNTLHFNYRQPPWPEVDRFLATKT